MSTDRPRATEQQRRPDAAPAASARVERSQPSESRPTNAPLSQQEKLSRTISGGVSNVDGRITLLKENRTLRADNEQLPSLVLERSMPSKQIQPERVYNSEFRELFDDIETWIVKMDASAGIQDLSASRANQILKGLRKIGRRCTSSAEFLQTNTALFQEAFRFPRFRVQLQRHIVGAILFDKVLAPMVFGISTDWMFKHLNEVMERDGMESHFT